MLKFEVVEGISKWRSKRNIDTRKSRLMVVCLVIYLAVQSSFTNCQKLIPIVSGINNYDDSSLCQEFPRYGQDINIYRTQNFR